jgi:hypothetical protein
MAFGPPIPDRKTDSSSGGRRLAGDARSRVDEIADADGTKGQVLGLSLGALLHYRGAAYRFRTRVRVASADRAWEQVRRQGNRGIGPWRGSAVLHPRHWQTLTRLVGISGDECSRPAIQRSHLAVRKRFIPAADLASACAGSDRQTADFNRYAKLAIARTLRCAHPWRTI